MQQQYVAAQITCVEGDYLAVVRPPEVLALILSILGSRSRLRIGILGVHDENVVVVEKMRRLCDMAYMLGCSGYIIAIAIERHGDHRGAVR